MQSVSITLPYYAVDKKEQRYYAIIDTNTSLTVVTVEGCEGIYHGLPYLMPEDATQVSADAFTQAFSKAQLGVINRLEQLNVTD